MMNLNETVAKADLVDEQLRTLLIQEEQLTGVQEVELWTLDQIRGRLLSLIYLQKSNPVTAIQTLTEWRLSDEIRLLEKQT